MKRKISPIATDVPDIMTKLNRVRENADAYEMVKVDPTRPTIHRMIGIPARLAMILSRLRTTMPLSFENASAYGACLGYPEDGFSKLLEEFV